MTAFLVTGYSGMDLGIFQEKDSRIGIIKQVIERDLERLSDEGVDWLIFTGTLGFENWVLDVAREMQPTVGFSLATIFPFEDHGVRWNDANQAKLTSFKTVDYVKYCFNHYENPGQFRQYHQFLLDNTDGAYVFYDTENETRLKFLYKQMTEKDDYLLKTLTFEGLNEFIESLND